jgi:hypothetical protein
MAMDQIHRGAGATMRPHLDSPDVAEALKHGDISKIIKALPAGVTRAEIEEYLKQRFVVLDQGLFQNVQIKADFASVPPPHSVKNILPMDSANALTEDETQYFRGMLGIGKAAVVGQGKAVEDPDAVPQTDVEKAQEDVAQFSNELLSTIRDRMQDRDEFNDQLEKQIFNVQLNMELLNKRHELKEELRRIIDLMKRGAIQPEFVLVALTKVQVSEQGLIASQMGRRMMNINEEQKTIAESIQGINVGDPGQVGEFEMKKLELQQSSMSMNMIMQNMQRAVQQVDTALSVGKSMLEEYTRTKGELIRAVRIP